MGNSTSRVVGCFAPFGNGNEAVDLEFLEPLDEGLGHSFCYVRPEITDSPAITPSNSERFLMDSGTLDGDMNSGSFRQEVSDDPSGRSNKNFSETTFKTISGASVSANASTARTGNSNLLFLSDAQEPAASFESTASFAAIPLQPVPRGSGPLNGFVSRPLERGFASGPLDKGRGFMSGPLDKGVFLSGPLESADRSNFSAPLSYGRKTGLRSLMRTMSRPMKSAFSRTFVKNPPGHSWIQRFFVQPMSQFVWQAKEPKFRPEVPRNCYDIEPPEKEYSDSRNLQWAHGKAGEDRVHVVLSEEQGWLFIGIYDGFSGPDAPDFLMSNLYRAIDRELEGLLWDYEDRFQPESPTAGAESNDASIPKEPDRLHVSECSVGRSESGHENEALHAYLSDSAKPKISSEHQEFGGTSMEIQKQFATKDSCIIQESAVDINQDDGYTDHESVERSVGTTGPLVPPEKDRSFVASTTLSRKEKKSMRLFELLQLELTEDHELFDIGSRRVASCSFRTSESEDLHLGESLPASQQYPCSPSTEKKANDSLGLDVDTRGNDGASCTESNDLGRRAAIYAAGNRQMMKRSLIGTKLRRFYMKQKSLRKKLFPWSYDWHVQHISVDERSIGPAASIRRCKSGPVDHDAVLHAMARALKSTEQAYMDMVEKTLDKNPELALMGSCVLVMLMKDQDVYVMNVGDSRVILAQERLTDRCGNSNPVKDDPKPVNRSRESVVRVELDRISEDSPMHNPNCKVGSVNKDREISIYRLKLRALQLSTDHCTSNEEEVLRIKAEHVDDAQAVFNDRVKGQLKVTRAFGAGFLKKSEFNEALLEMFRIDYIGNSPYLSCVPSVLHHRLCASDRFLVLSSDGLYQYFSNEEVVSHVGWFMENVPEGDPAQYLIAELLFRAAKKNGMDFHELLDIPHGDRRKYHDDVSVMVVSLEGRIWRSCG